MSAILICLACGAQHHDVAEVCASCGCEQLGPNVASPHPFRSDRMQAAQDAHAEAHPDDPPLWTEEQIDAERAKEAKAKAARKAAKEEQAKAAKAAKAELAKAKAELAKTNKARAELADELAAAKAELAAAKAELAAVKARAPKA